ncbi:uncharacterized protein TNCV_2362041 [Trichonephila clavipes]|nr:uncharacterized protein TNCV_2362041 [Trichonephila clavipes]
MITERERENDKKDYTSVFFQIVRHLKKSDPNFYDLLVLFFQSRSMISMKTKPEQPDEEATYKEKLDLQLRKDRCYTLIYTNISSDLKNLITETTDGVAAWKILKDHFEPVTKARVIQLLDQFFGTKYQPGEDVGIFISRVKTAATRLQEAGHKLDDLYIGFQLIRWLPQEFQSTVCNKSTDGKKRTSELSKLKQS